jgi:hypothetical protein
MTRCKRHQTVNPAGLGSNPTTPQPTVDFLPKMGCQMG